MSDKTEKCACGTHTKAACDFAGACGQSAASSAPAWGKCQVLRDGAVSSAASSGEALDWPHAPGRPELNSAPASSGECEYSEFSSRVCKRGTRGCNSAHAAKSSGEAKGAAEYASLKTEIETLQYRLGNAMRELESRRLHDKGDTWFWQGDGTDDLASMGSSMAVVIRADQLRALAATVHGEGLSFGRKRRESMGAEIAELQDALAAAAAAQPSAAEQAKAKLLKLVNAASAVIERWDSPKWKDLPHTAESIHRLRAAVAEASSNSATPAPEQAPAQSHVMPPMRGTGSQP